jgi:hypothetical protein
MNGISSFREVWFSLSRSPSYPFLREQRPHFGIDTCYLFKLTWFLQRRQKIAVE